MNCNIIAQLCALTVQMMPLGPISCENFVIFGPVTPELTDLICERQIRAGYTLDFATHF